MGFTTNPDGSVTDERTGQTFINAAIGYALGYGTGSAPAPVEQPPLVIPESESSPGGFDYRQRDAAGQLTTIQENSNQYWMNAGYTGKDPSMAIKAAYSDAQYAYNNAVAIAQAAEN